MTEQVTEESVKKATQETLEQVEEIQQEQQEADPVENKAREMGWTPKDEFSGDPETFVEAKEFVERAPLYKALHQANRKIKKMQETLETFRDHYTKVEVAAKERAIKELQSQLETASEERDIKKALEIKDKITEVQSQGKETETKTNPDFESWVEENKWYNDDPKLKTFATGIGFGLAQEHPDWTPAKIFQEVTKITKESFPDKFTVKKPATKVSTNARTTGGSDGKRTPSIRQLPEEARVNYNRLVKSDRNPHGILTPEEFWKDYLAAGGTTLSAE